MKQLASQPFSRRSRRREKSYPTSTKCFIYTHISSHIWDNCPKIGTIFINLSLNRYSMSADMGDEKSLKIILYLLRNFDTQPHVRCIARNTDVSTSSTGRILAKLNERDIVRRREQGNQTLYSLNYDNPLVIHHCSLALAIEFDRIKENHPSLHKHLRSFADSCDKAIGRNILSIVLFGSAAIGEHEKTSDLDLLVITDDLTHTKKVEHVSSAINASYSHDISPTTITEDAFLSELYKNNLLYQNILREGIPIHGSENYLRITFKYMRTIK